MAPVSPGQLLFAVLSIGVGTGPTSIEMYRGAKETSPSATQFPTILVARLYAAYGFEFEVRKNYREFFSIQIADEEYVSKCKIAHQHTVHPMIPRSGTKPDWGASCGHSIKRSSSSFLKYCINGVFPSEKNTRHRFGT